MFDGFGHASFSVSACCVLIVPPFQAMLNEKIKIQGLRTYLFTYASCYDSLSLDQVCDMFDMPKSTAHSVISKMMISGELHGSWDQPTETVVLQKVQPNRLEVLSLQFADKVGGVERGGVVMGEECEVVAATTRCELI